ncbi:protein sprouty [Lucilia cuprina]|uniref:protein sprouty n=1 Tax=Lucilia cuprina TaxID=7375 RepID=UPI001F063E1B|nr:protein sprouty [Lucilia cuprina]XP_046807182.1 protein sprouty [Lucilia cuprina]
MDRRNGGDPLAPPRPPKLLPKVHRPRAPEPEMMSAVSQTTSQTTPVATASVAATATAGVAVTNVVNTPQCTNQSDLSRNNNLNQPHHLSSINSTSSLWSSSVANSASTIPTTTTSPPATVPLVANNIRYNRVSYNNNHIGNIDVVTQQPTQFDDYQIHHLTFLPQRPCNLSRNNSHVSSSSSSSSVTVSNSFTRRRPPPPTPGSAGSAVPLLTISGNNNNNNNFLNHFHSAEPVPTSPVTLAQPRPESERLANEYVDTPLRTAQQLQNATRMQHPAGQHDNGQTTTHHLLLLPQRELRQQQQQQSQNHQHLHRLAGTAGSANATMGIDGTDGLLHSQHHHHNIHNHQTHHQLHNPKASTKPATVTEKLSPKPETRGFLTPGIQPINQPITKQPALSNTDNACKFAKELPALDELLDIHSIATGISTPQGMVSAVNGASPLGTPIVIGSSDAPSSLNPITCPRCDRCRCEQCQSPRPLPQTWVCNKTCLCSAESIIDYASCLCCAKALFYHCARDNDMDCDDSSGTPCVDNPCSCGPYKRTQRWGWLGALSLVLPCLWCYWPMRGCVAMCEKCYGKFAKRGCRCQQIGSTSSMFPITSASNGANIVVLSNGTGLQSNTNGTTKSSATSGNHHHIHHNDCSTTSRILRKGDLTPEKRLLDSSPEY